MAIDLTRVIRRCVLLARDSGFNLKYESIEDFVRLSIDFHQIDIRPSMVRNPECSEEVMCVFVDHTWALIIAAMEVQKNSKDVSSDVAAREISDARLSKTPRLFVDVDSDGRVPAISGPQDAIDIDVPLVQSDESSANEKSNGEVQGI